MTSVDPGDAPRQSRVDDQDSAGRLLDLALAGATIDELGHLLDALAGEPRPLDRSTARSMAGKSLVVLVNKQLRALLLARNPVARARAVAGLARLRECVTARYLALRSVSPADPEAATTRDSDAPESVSAALSAVYKVLLKRTASAAEIEIWKRHLSTGIPFHEIFLRIQDSDEAKRAQKPALLAEQSDGRFIQVAYEIILGHGVHPRDIEHWTKRLRSGAVDRAGVVSSLLQVAVRERDTPGAVHDGLSCRLMGTRDIIGVEDWKRRKAAVATQAPPPVATRYRNRFHIRGAPRFLVTAIASLYRGGDFIEQFMDNITSQTIFGDYAELVIVDAESPDDEARTIARYLAKYDNIRYLRMNYRIGIYDAWNVGVGCSRGEYLTNTNLDDLRRADSFELQAGVLDNLPFVDVVYQDFYYTFDPSVSAEQAALFGFRSHLPIVTPHNMLLFNSPHNAPMWRKRLHDELGLFDTHYRSAGDYEFWLRCLAANKGFYKLNDPHVVYYQNPNGLSTRPDTRGVVEARQISKKYAALLTSEHMLSDQSEFFGRFGVDGSRCLGRGAVDRYSVVQQGLRQLGRTWKYACRRPIR